MMEIDEQMNLEIDQRKGEIKYFFDVIISIIEGNSEGNFRSLC